MALSTSGTAQLPHAAHAAAAPDLHDRDFARVCAITYASCGIKLGPGKEGLVRSRLAKRVRAAGLDSFGDYLRLVESEAGRAELAEMVDALTTNKTNFFRESAHFDFLGATVLPALAAAGGPARIWSAGCSTGEEPYTIAMTACERLAHPERLPVRILATDISARVLARAKAGVYTAEQLDGVPPAALEKYFERAPEAGAGARRVGDRARALVKFGRLNLMEAWPMRGPFEAILCRNVMIYFDKETQERLVNRYYDLLAPGGHLFVGHSESLTGLRHQFAYVQPAVYRK